MLLRLATITLCTAGAALAAHSKPDVAAPPTFYREVLPILQRNCQSCHRPGEIGPMALVDYEGTRPWAKAIKEAVVLRRMPPWFADQQVGHFSNDRRLPDADIRVIVDWVNAGAPAGDPNDAPAPARWINGWSIGEPEQVFEMPAAFPVPAEGVLPYQYVVVPTHFETDRWVRLAEVRAGDRKHTHHIVVSIREPESTWLRGYPEGVPFALRPGDSGGGMPGEFLAGYGPGAMPETLGAGEAKLVKAGSDLVFQLHYTTDGRPGSDVSRAGLVFCHEKPRQRVFMLAAANVRFVIPAGNPDVVLTSKLVLHHEASLVSLLPHMHLRGKSFEFRAVFPNGERKTLLRVPNYNYNWQLSYYLAERLRLPADTSIECVAHYDNSPNNPMNPDPAATVRFGPQSSDEMMIGYFEVAADPEVDLRDLLIGSSEIDVNRTESRPAISTPTSSR